MKMSCVKLVEFHMKSGICVMVMICRLAEVFKEAPVGRVCKSWI